MRKIIIVVFRIFFLLLSVLFGFYLIRAIKSKRFNISPQLAQIRKRLANYRGDPSQDEALAEILAKEDIDSEAREWQEKYENETAQQKSPGEITQRPEQMERVNTGDTSELSLRQKEMLNILQLKKTVDMKVLLARITGVTERTLRRDLLKLQELGFVKKEGNTKSVKYHLLSN